MSMFMTPKQIVGALLVIVALVVAFGFVYAFWYDRSCSYSTEYLRRRRERYRTGGSFLPITAEMSREIFRELKLMPLCATDESFWHVEYADLLEFFLAVADDRHHPDPQLVYGVFAERGRGRKRKEKMFRELVWMTYSHGRQPWVLWVDANRNSPDGFLLRNDSYAMFQSLGEIVNRSVVLDYPAVRAACEARVERGRS